MYTLFNIQIKRGSSWDQQRRVVDKSVIKPDAENSFDIGSWKIEIYRGWFARWRHWAVIHWNGYCILLRRVRAAMESFVLGRAMRRLPSARMTAYITVSGDVRRVLIESTGDKFSPQWTERHLASSDQSDEISTRSRWLPRERTNEFEWDADGTLRRGRAGRRVTRLQLSPPRVAPDAVALLIPKTFSNLTIFRDADKPTVSCRLPVCRL